MWQGFSFRHYLHIPVCHINNQRFFHLQTPSSYSDNPPRYESGG
jgi:hypothetical protein